MDIDDLKDLPEPSRTRAKALLTCRLCNKYFLDPRVLPCRHSFCKKCLQDVYDDLQANAKPASRRVGSMPCPTCNQPIGVPLSGVKGFPVDTKIQRIKDLVVTEITKNLSQKMNSGSKSSTRPKSQYDDEDVHSTRSADDARSGNKNADPRQRDHSYDFATFSEKAGTGTGYRRNPAYPDFSKFARYFDHDGKPAESKPFKSNLRTDRQRLGYSNSFQHARRRVPLRTKAYDDSADLFIGSTCYGSAPVVSDEKEQEQRTRDHRSSEQEGLSSDRSYSARPTSRRYSPANNVEMSGEERESERYRSGSWQQPQQQQQGSSFREDRDSGRGQYRDVPDRAREIPKEKTDDKFSRQEKPREKPDVRSETNVRREGGTRKRDLFDDVLTEGKDEGGGRDRPKPRRSIHTEDAAAEPEEETGRRAAPRSSRLKSTLPTHRENISTDTTEAQGRFSRQRNEAKPSSPSKEGKTGGVRFSEEGKPAATGRRLPKTPPEAVPRFEEKEREKEETSEDKFSRRRQSSYERKDEGERGERVRRTESAREPGYRTRVVDFGDERQAPVTSSSYTSSRRRHDFIDDEVGRETETRRTDSKENHRFVNVDERQAPASSSRYRTGRRSHDIDDNEQEPETSSAYNRRRTRDGNAGEAGKGRTGERNSDFSDSTDKHEERPKTKSAEPSYQMRYGVRVDIADEGQAPGTSSSYRTGHRHHDVIIVDDSEESKREQDQERTESRSRTESKSAGMKTREERNNDSMREREKEREKEKSLEARGEGSSHDSTDREQGKKADIHQKGGETNETAEPVKPPRRQRANKSERLNRNAERVIQDGGQLDETVRPERPYRSREQKRQDARRSFSVRIKEVFEEYTNHYSEREPGEDSCGTSVDQGLYIDEEGGSTQGGSGPGGSTQGGSNQGGSTQSGSNEDKAVEEKPGRNWEEFISNARAKYSSERIEKEKIPLEEPVCAEGVYSRWRLQKAEFGIPTSMAITSKGYVIVAEYGLGCVEYYDEGGGLSHSMGGVKPFSVIVNDKDQVIVGDRRGKAVRIFDEFGGDVSHWDATTFNWICGISAVRNSPSGNLVIYDRERCKLGLYSPPGELIREFQSSYGSNESQLCMADFIACDTRGRVLVADSGNHCIKIFDSSTGAFIGKFGQRGVEDGCLEWPKGICVDSEDNIIVTDVHNKRISVFSGEGKFIRHLVTGVLNPYSVCYSASVKGLGITQYHLDGTSQYDVYGIE